MQNKNNKKSMLKQNTETLTPNRKYKDTMFRLLFKEKYAALSLYNALNGTTHTDEEEMEIVTLENAIYINVKNDLAFVLDSNLNLYEHQSTYNPNMPLRDLIYVAKEFQKFVDNHSLYSEKPVVLPYPKFVVFYNGIDERPEKEILKLSDLYNAAEDLRENPELELKVIVLNINKGYNEDLKRKCPLLLEYMQYVDKVRYYKEEKKMDLPDAVECTIADCVKEGILEEFLRKNRAEVLDVSIFEYNAEEEIRKYKIAQQELWREQGLKAGMEEGRKEGIKEGIEEGMREGMRAGRIDGAKQKCISLILMFLKEVGEVSESLEEMLKAQDEEKLDKLVKIASKTESLEQFMSYVQ